MSHLSVNGMAQWVMRGKRAFKAKHGYHGSKGKQIEYHRSKEYRSR